MYVSLSRTSIILTENVTEKRFYPYRPICMLPTNARLDDGCSRNFTNDCIFNGNNKYHRLLLLWVSTSKNEVSSFEVLLPNLPPYASF